MTPEEFNSRLLPVKNKIYRFSLSLLMNKQEAEDATQEVYLKMWDMRNQLGKYKNMEALMMTITKNHCLDRLRVKKNKAASLDVNVHDSHSENPQQIAEQADMLNRVLKVMQSLPEQQKTIVHLRDIEGYAFDELQEITGFDLNYIRVNLSRGRKKIRETIHNLERHETSST
ncbi:MAG: sigma-70 family RNA polymerase sigma factor [bacterium]|jgi:RNA polymerase sigma factor (sigma-70 family)